VVPGGDSRNCAKFQEILLDSAAKKNCINFQKKLARGGFCAKFPRPQIPLHHFFAVFNAISLTLRRAFSRAGGGGVSGVCGARRPARGCREAATMLFYNSGSQRRAQARICSCYHIGKFR